jgi:excisionase family DNA binding protein
MADLASANTPVFDPVLDAHQVATVLGQSLYTTQRQFRDGVLPGIKLPGGRWRMKREDLQAILDGRGT